MQIYSARYFEVKFEDVCLDRLRPPPTLSDLAKNAPRRIG